MTKRVPVLAGGASPRRNRASGGLAPDGRAKVDSKVGHIRILAKLGEGGMGEVYVGFDETLQRKVALKSIAGRYRLSEAAQARFVREARILSQLDHPNICRIYDFIEEGDSDYLVLELIEGRDLGAAASELGRRSKLRIARDIAAVLAAAHGEGIVHRDLKPGNVMLTPEGEVKVLDFGLARTEDPRGKRDSGLEPGLGSEASLSSTGPAAQEPTEADDAKIADRLRSGEAGPDPGDDVTLAAVLDPEPPASGDGATGRLLSLRTEHGTVVGTPHFMSPEQARGERVTTASDMYSFGLLVQSLFTGRSPYPQATSAVEVLELAERGKARPFVAEDRDLLKLVGRLKSPAPAARPTAETTLERLRWILDKPKRRLRRLTVAALLAIAALAGVKYTVDLDRERSLAVAARQVAEQRRGQAENLIGFMLGDLREKLEPVGRLEILDEVGDQAMEYFAAVPGEELSDEELLARSKALNQIGGVRIDQGRLPDAAPAFEESLRLARDLVERQPNESRFLARLGEAFFWLGYQRWTQGDLDGSHRYYSDYLDNSERLVGLEPDSVTWQTEVAYGHANVGGVERSRGNLESAERHFRRSIELTRELVARDPTNEHLQKELGTFMSWRGSTLEERGDLVAAQEQFEEELQLRQAALERDASNAGARLLLAFCRGYLGLLSRDQGDIEEGIRQLSGQLDLLEELARGDPSNLEWQRHLAVGRLHLGETLLATGAVGAAAAHLEGGLEVALDLVRADSLNSDWLRQRAALGTATATARLAQGDPRAALREAELSLETIEAVLAAAPDDRKAALTFARNQILIGRVQAALDERLKAKEAWELALERIEPLASASTDRDLLATWAAGLLHLGRLEEARPVTERLRAQGYREPRFQALWEETVEVRRPTTDRD